MNYEDYIKKHLVGLIMLIAAAIGLTLIISPFVKGPTQDKSSAPIITAVQKTEVPQSQLPEKFPANLPIEAGAIITQNYNASAEDGRYQATRAFETKKSLTENLNIYTKYLKDNSWKIQSSVDRVDYKLISGKKGIQVLQISLSENVNNQSRNVSISLTELP